MARSDGDQSCSPADGSGLRELSLEEVLRSYEQPINEEQAWAVCFQCCFGLQDLRGPRHPCVQPSSLLLQRDGSIRVLQSQDGGGSQSQDRGGPPRGR
uniref:KIND domain-containing protein n=1 Tax=Knipowitschia caucasica TaxID=637954 RepID=A0AAV2KYI4_KNICA